jgi:very-short-patch-repair endonuclease
MKNRTSDADLFKGAKMKHFELARKLRKNQTIAEELLWNELRKKKMEGLKFRRQHPIARFSVDFYCHEKALVIEVDGEYHNALEAQIKDKERTEALESLELNVIRFTNEEVICDMAKVLKAISEYLKRSTNENEDGK